MPAYYQIINGQRYDRGLLEAAQQLTEGRGDGRISQKDAAILLDKVQDGRGITPTEKRTLRYLLETLKWTEKAAEWINTQLDLSTTQEAEHDQAAHLIRTEFDLPSLSYHIEPGDIAEQESLAPNQISFADALRLALQTLLTNDSPRESPRFLIGESFGLFPAQDPGAEDRITAHLREFLLAGALRLLPNLDWNDADVEFDFNPPEEGETVVDNWIFTLSLPTLSDHAYWIVVPRDGAAAAYIYGFN